MAVPYTFGSATTSIPLSQLDSNFATTITLGNTAIQLGNTVTTLNNMTLGNVTVSSGNVVAGIASSTITQSMLATGVAGTGPAFSAYNSSDQSITTATWTKLAANTKEFDTNSCYDNATNYRFTPTIAGYYQVNGKITVYASVATANLIIAIYKNGTIFKRGSYNINPSAQPDTGVVVSSLIYLNGSTDYIELYGNSSFTGTNTFNSGASYSYFQAAMVRGA
jgi:hypothetical protein